MILLGACSERSRRVGALPLLPLSHADVTRALVRYRLGAVSPNCEEQVVVCSQAAPSVRAGKAL